MWDLKLKFKNSNFISTSDYTPLKCSKMLLIIPEKISWWDEILYNMRMPLFIRRIITKMDHGFENFQTNKNQSNDTHVSCLVLIAEVLSSVIIAALLITQ